MVKIEPRWTGSHYHVLDLWPAGVASDGSTRVAQRFVGVVNVQVGEGVLFFVETDPNSDLNVQHAYPLPQLRHWTVTRGDPLGSAGAVRPTVGRVGT